MERYEIHDVGIYSDIYGYWCEYSDHKAELAKKDRLYDELYVTMNEEMDVLATKLTKKDEEIADKNETINEINNERLRLRKALEFYADENTYKGYGTVPMIKIGNDRGKIACEALEHVSDRRE